MNIAKKTILKQSGFDCRVYSRMAFFVRFLQRYFISVVTVHAVLNCYSGHRLACTSPIWARSNRSMHRRDWPIPPPIVYGSSPFKIIW